jgi:hypothetical protein
MLSSSLAAPLAFVLITLTFGFWLLAAEGS